jgi:predicted ATPase
MARVWPDTFVEEGSIKVHVAGLRRALGDGQPGRRYLANVPGRGYRFVAPIELPEPERLPTRKSVAEKQPRLHNLPIAQARTLGRADVISTLMNQLPRQRFITIVGAGGIGKTTVALAVAEALLPAYEHGVWLVDLALVDGPHFVPNALGMALGLAVHSENAISWLINVLRDKQMLFVFDNCEHVTVAAATLAEQLLAGASGIHILATSREPLRAHGERVRRLSPLASPAASSDLTAAKALEFPAVQLFVERAAAISDEFELSDPDAPIVVDICRKLGGLPLAIELAASRFDAFGAGQLSLLLDDRFRILNQGRRTAQPRHRSLTAALDWSYEYLPETERCVLRGLSVFAGAFTLESAIAVAGDDKSDVVEAVANLVTKSLVSADGGEAIVQYRLLETTRAYALQKLEECGLLQEYRRRHAQHQLDCFKPAESDWSTHSSAEWRARYASRLDDVRSALTWAFSPNGDAPFGVALTVASIPLWSELSLIDESCESFERALANQAADPTHSERDEMMLLVALGTAHSYGPLPADELVLTRALRLAEKLGDVEYQMRALVGLYLYHLYLADHRGTLAVAQKIGNIAAITRDSVIVAVGDSLTGAAQFYLGDHSSARQNVDRVANRDIAPDEHLLLVHRATARGALSAILWVQGFPDQAFLYARNAIADAGALDSGMLLCTTYALMACPVALYVGDFTTAESWATSLLDLTAKYSLSALNARGRALRGMLLLERGDVAGLTLLQDALAWLNTARITLQDTAFLGALARGLGATGRIPEAQIAIGEALERSDRNEELWCRPELLRIKGELARLGGSAGKVAEDYFEQALDCARRQGALSWELRAATSLARLWHRGGKTVEAHDQLAAIYNRFTEGFDTVDLRTARALIDELRKGAS